MRGTTTSLTVGPWSVTVPDTAGSLTIPADASGGGLSNDLLPWTTGIDVFPTAVTQTNWDTLTVNTSVLYGAVKESSGAQNDEIGFDVTLAKGTYTVELIYFKATANGVFSVQFNGVEKGTVDGYVLGGSYNNRSQITGIAVGTSGKVRLLLKMATKNASATNYKGEIQHIQIKRTA